MPSFYLNGSEIKLPSSLSDFFSESKPSVSQVTRQLCNENTLYTYYNIKQKSFKTVLIWNSIPDSLKTLIRNCF